MFWLKTLKIVLMFYVDKNPGGYYIFIIGGILDCPTFPG